MSDARQIAHQLVDSLPDRQLAGLVGFLRTIVGPDRDLPDDEPITEEDRRRIDESKRWFAERGGKGVSMEEVLAEYGLTTEDFPVER